MGKYFIVQLKRMCRLIPIMVLVAALLFGGVFIAYRGILSSWERGEVFQKLQIGIVGTTEDQLLEAAFDAAKSMDATNMSIEFVQLQEKQAVSCLERGEISAYLVFPEQFLEQALRGEIVPIRFVSVAGKENIVSLVKDEFASVFANMLLTSEQGAFALADALTAYGKGNIAGEKMNELAFAYAEMIFNRDEVYKVEELGIASGLSFAEYMTCGLSTLFGFLLTLPFAPVLVQDRFSLERLLKSRGIGAVSQVICELGAYMLLLTIMAAIPVGLVGNSVLRDGILVLPAIACIAAMSYFLYSLCSDLLSAVLLQLVGTLVMCFLSGCMYPTHFFPIVLQKISSVLPAGMVKNYLGSIFYGEPSVCGWILLGVSILFASFAICVRFVRISGKRGAAV